MSGILRQFGQKIVMTVTTAFLGGLVTLSSASAADLYFGGDIITMAGDQPHYVESLVSDAGKIAFVGDLATAREKFGKDLVEHDLEGKTLLPGFIDGHGHIYNTGLMYSMANLLPPPDGTVNSFDTLVEVVSKWTESEEAKPFIKETGWIMGNGYDDSQLAEKDHPSKQVLDKISTELPIAVIHQSGHLASVNSKALEIAGYTKDTPDPKGGAIRRDKDGNPTGVLEEAAFFNILLPVAMKIAPNLQAQFIQKGQMLYVENGYTTAEDGRTTADGSAAMEQAAKDGKLFIDLVSFPDIAWNSKAIAPPYHKPDKSYTNHYRVGGAKLTLDGSPQGKTAWLTHPYHVAPPGQDADYHGYAIMSDEEAAKWAKLAFKNRWQLHCHTNGDAAIDQYLKAITEAQKEFGYDDHRTVMVHGQTLRKDQIPRLVKQKILPSLFPMHTFYWGDWHLESVLGSPRAEYISPARDVIDAGLTITSHHDAPVTIPNAARVLDATVNRVTRSGKVLGPDQRISAYEGLLALTRWAAFQLFEENTKGTLEAGKLADLVILDKNPLKIDPLKLSELTVLQTIKEGKTVFSK